MHILEKTHRNFRKTFDFIRMEFTCVCYAEINSEKINGREKKDESIDHNRLVQGKRQILRLPLNLTPLL